MPLGKNLPPNSRAKNRMPENWAAGIVGILLLFFFHGRAFSQCSPAWPECGSGPGLPDGAGCRMTQDLTLAGGTVDKFIEICGDGLTLNGNGAKITGPVILQNRSGVTINNLTDPSFTWQSSSNNTITGCTGVLYVSMDASSNFNSVLANNALAAGSYIGLAGSNNSILNNSFNSNPSTVVIDIFQGSMNNLIQGNTINGPAQGISIGTNSNSNTVINNRFVGNATGVWIGGAHNNQIRWNSFQNCAKGVAIYATGSYPATGNVIAEDTLEGSSEQGIWIFNARNNTVVRNMVRNNQIGIMEDGILVDSNLIINNNIVTNTANQGLGNSDFWDDAVCGGNYWSDYDEPAEGCVDTDSNGICDTPRPTPPDSFPFVNQDGWLNQQPPPGDTCERPDFDLAIRDVKPIQVIEGAPLVVDKATMVRVFVRLTGRQQLDNVMLSMSFGGLGAEYQTSTLINYRNETFVLPPEEVAPFLNLVNQGDDTQIGRQYVAKGFTSFNFAGPYTPTQPGPVNVSAFIDPLGQHTEFFENNNQLAKNVEAKLYFKGQKAPGDPYPYIIDFRPAINILGGSHRSSMARLKADAQDWANFVEATYPIPKVRMNFLASTLTSANINPFGLQQIPFSLLLGLGQFNALLFGVDRTVYIMPDGALAQIADAINDGETQGMTTPAINSTGILVEEDAAEHVVAHETGHTYGLEHDYDFLYQFGRIAANGWDVRQLTINTFPPRGPKISIEENNPTGAFNFYSIMQGSDQNPWPTRSQYLSLMDQLVTGGRDPWLLIMRGLFFQNDSLLCLPSYVVEGVSDSIQPGNYSVVTLDSNGTVLDSVSFEPFFLHDTAGVEATFSFAIPFDSHTKKIMINHGATLLREIVRSPYSPSVTINAVQDQGNGIFDVSWSQSDADGDTLYHFIYYSPDSVDWYLLYADFVGTSLQFNTAELPGGGSAFIKIITTDGMNTVQNVSSPFSVSNKVPLAIISSPQADSTYATGTEIQFDGAASHDPEGATLNYQWTSSLDGVIGTQAYFTKSDLSEGNHAITLTVTDDQNQSASDSIQIVIGVCATAKGDLNGDTLHSPADVVLLLNCLFLGTGNCDPCFADVNCDGNLTPADVVLELNRVFLDSPFPC